MGTHPTRDRQVIISSSPHQVKSYEEMLALDADDRPTQYVRLSLNGIRLVAQLLTAAFLIMGLDLKVKGDRDWVSGCLPTHRIFGILLLILLMWSKY